MHIPNSSTLFKYNLHLFLEKYKTNINVLLTISSTLSMFQKGEEAFLVHICVYVLNVVKRLNGMRRERRRRP